MVEKTYREISEIKRQERIFNIGGGISLPLLSFSVGFGHRGEVISTESQYRIQRKIKDLFNSILEEINWTNGKNNDVQIKNMIIIVLDRLTPEKALNLIENLRFYFYIGNIMVIMGVNEDVLAKHLSSLLGLEGPEASRFLDKIFNIRIPLAYYSKVNNIHLSELHCSEKENLHKLFEAIVLYIGRNGGLPHRIIIKLINNFYKRVKSFEISEEEEFQLLAKFNALVESVILETIFPLGFSRILRNKPYMPWKQEHIKSEIDKSGSIIPGISINMISEFKVEDKKIFGENVNQTIRSILNCLRGEKQEKKDENGSNG